MKKDAGVPSPAFCLPDVIRLVELLARCWSRDTSSGWSPEAPARGQCSVTALVLQDHFGGEILKSPVGASCHFYNRIGGLRLDATGGQFRDAIHYVDLLSSREEALADTAQAQYEELSRRFAAALHDSDPRRIGEPPESA
jgi:hypothetical protein